MKKILKPAERKELKRLIKKVEAEKRQIAKSRDKLRDYLSSMDDIVESSEEAINDLARACNTLSQYL